MNKLRNFRVSLKTRLWRFIFLAVELALIVSLGVSPAWARASTFTENVKVPTELFVFVPCALGGAGEYVFLSGPLHILFVTTIDSKGGFHSKYHFQPQGISGTGFTTGDKYQATGETQGTFNGRVGYEETYVNNFKIIGQGPGNNFLVHENLHIVVNANGELIAFVDNYSVECKSVSYP